MRIVLFYHSLLSDWNHGNAHFLRGYASELARRGHRVDVYEPQGAWSLRHLLHDHGRAPLDGFRRSYPLLRARVYDPATIDLDRELDGASLVIAHEWNDPSLIAALGSHRARARSYRLLFHDTHHRAISDAAAMGALDLRDYDGVLAFGEVLRECYLDRCWAQHVWTWHEAADVVRFTPDEEAQRTDDLVWVGNWGDGERGEELTEFLLEPVAALGTSTSVYGVRYPSQALGALHAAGIRYRGFAPNYAVPRLFARARVTVHVPRRAYATDLPGIPTIRPFEAMACGIPLICSPWADAESLFRRGRDHLVAPSGAVMKRLLREVLSDRETREELAAEGLRTIRERHTCAHRVDQLLAIVREIDSGGAAA